VSHIFSRTELMLGKERLEILKQKRVMIFGLGGVGSFAAEALARAGIGNLVLVDHDKVDVSNINRQLLALHSTLGKYKVHLMQERVKDINPEAQVKVFKEFYSQENAEDFFNENPDYIVDAIDTVSSKVNLLENAFNRNIPIISSMGAGNRLDPSKLRLADISETTVCPLARTVRKELRKKGIASGIDVVFSTEQPIKPAGGYSKVHGRHIPGSISFVPPVSGFLLASRVVNKLLNVNKE